MTEYGCWHHADGCPGRRRVDGEWRHLLTAPESQHKIELSLGKHVYTEVLHLAPADRSGREVCPWRSAGCTKACLNVSGHNLIDYGRVAKQQGITLDEAMAQRGGGGHVEKARVRRTEQFFAAHDLRQAGPRDEETHKLAPYQGSRERGEAWDFWTMLIADLDSVRRKVREKGAAWQGAIRLNGTSDLPWESYPVCINGITYPNVMAVYPELHFYDYSKGFRRVLFSLEKAAWPANYTLTYSLSEKSDGPHEAEQVLERGGQVAVVFKGHLPGSMEYRISPGGRVWPIVDATKHDARFIDPRPSIAGLVALGVGKRDVSGFVRNPDAFEADLIPRVVDPSESELIGEAGEEDEDEGAGGEERRRPSFAFSLTSRNRRPRYVNR